MSENFEKEVYIAELLTKMTKVELTPEENIDLIDWRKSSAENDKVFEELSRMESLMEALENLYRFKEKVWNHIAS
jgi:hypothetical protein